MLFGIWICFVKNGNDLCELELLCGKGKYFVGGGIALWGMQFLLGVTNSFWEMNLVSVTSNLALCEQHLVF